MSNTSKTDELREVIVGQYKEDELTGNGMGNILSALTDIETLERERDEVRSDLEFRRDLFQLQEKQLNEVRAERDSLQEQLDAAIMLGKMQERRHERELEQVREQYRLSSVYRKLLEENKQLKGDP